MNEYSWLDLNADDLKFLENVANVEIKNSNETQSAAISPEIVCPILPLQPCIITLVIFPILSDISHSC